MGERLTLDLFAYQAWFSDPNHLISVKIVDMLPNSAESANFYRYLCLDAWEPEQFPLAH